MKIPITIQEKITRWKDKAEVFLENNIKVFIKTIEGAYYSGDILFVGELTLTVYDNVKKKNCKIYWLDVTLFEEFEKEKDNEKDKFKED